MQTTSIFPVYFQHQSLVKYRAQPSEKVGCFDTDRDEGTQGWTSSTRLICCVLQGSDQPIEKRAKVSYDPHSMELTYSRTITVRSRSTRTTWTQGTHSRTKHVESNGSRITYRKETSRYIMYRQVSTFLTHFAWRFSYKIRKDSWNSWKHPNLGIHYDNRIECYI